MRLYAILLITWAAIIIASSRAESNASNSNDEQAIDYTESRDSPARQIVQPYVTTIEARNSGQTGTEDHSNDVVSAGLSGSTAVRSGERESNDATTTDSSSAVVYVTPFTSIANDAYLFGKLNLHESEYTIPDDMLVVENAGSFGQRVQQGHMSEKKIAKNTEDRENDNYRKSFSSTVSLLEDKGDHGTSYASIKKPLVLKKEHGSTDDSPPTESKEIRFEAFGSNFDEVSSATMEIQPLNKDIALNEDESENFPQSQARSSREYNNTANKHMKNFPEPAEKSKSIARTSTSETNPSLQLRGFSGPIIVPDLPDEEIRDVVVDYLNDDNLDASGIRSFDLKNKETNLETDAKDSKTAATNSITMSSIVLKPLQVGITLMNADEAALATLIDNEQSTATNMDYLQNNVQRLAIANEGLTENKENQSGVSYKDKNFQQVEQDKPIEVVTPKVFDNSVEIQKSIELFHTAPIHEIHYPVEYIRQTSNFGVIDTNNIGKTRKWKQPYAQERSKLQSNYDVYQGNNQVEKNVIKGHASTLSQRYNPYDVSESKPTTLIAKYSSNTHEQIPAEEIESQAFKYNNVQSVLVIPSQSDALRQSDQSDLRHNFNSDSDVRSRAKPVGSSARQGAINTYVKTYVSSTNRAQQPQSNQLTDQQHPFHSPETRRLEAQQQLLLKIIPGSAGNGGFLVPLPHSYPIEKIVEKTVHTVPHPVEVEKTVPLPVEKQVQLHVQVPVPVAMPMPVPVPQSYPVHMQVVPERVQHLYPIHIERRVPYTLVQRPLPQSSAYPLHLRFPAAYPAAHAPAEKVAEKSVVPGTASRPLRPYRTDVERQASIDNSSIDTIFDKYRQKSKAESILENIVPRGSGEPTARPSEVNASRFHHGDAAYATERPSVAYNYVNAPYYPDIRLMILPRGYGSHTMTSRPHIVSSLYAVPVSLKRQIAYNLVEKDAATKSDEYVGPAQLSHKNAPQSKMRSPQYPTSVAAQSQLATTTVLRKSRQPETRYPGSFRQSKMEYGFKPPMVPSVQYDENTATKVEN